MNQRDRFFRQCDADVTHQSMAGLASWAAFSARWRARQGLPLLHPMDVQYLTPQDFCTCHRQPLPPEKQRRLFRQYVEAALHTTSSTSGRRRPSSIGADLAFIRAEGLVRFLGLRQDYVYGRPDIEPHALEAYSPARPYGIPTTSSAFPVYWITGESDTDEDGDDSWITGAESRGA
jgi:hypothetical protein